MDPASIRSNNPGAMWGKGNAIAVKWGSTTTEALADGLGQGNNIAHFPTKVQGAAAQFDLWHQRYCNMTLRAAITKWSGGNWSQPYANFLTQHTGLAMDTMVTPVLLSGPIGLLLMKYQAQWEAGRPYPMTDAEWKQAQQLAFGITTAAAPAPATVHINPTVTFAIKVPDGVNLEVEVNGRTITL